MRTDHLHAVLIAALTWLLSACTTPDRVILLPQADGKSSALVIKGKEGSEVVLSKPYDTAEVTTRQISISVSDPKDVAVRYKSLSDALPVQIRSYLLYFDSGGDQLTPESERRVDEILRAIAQLPAPEIAVIGHTDTVGSNAANDRISLQRAEVIRARLIEKGISKARIETVGRGQRELLVPTTDGVDEPRNRRVEIRLK